MTKMTEYKKLKISGDPESVKLNVESIEDLVLEGKAEINNAHFNKGKNSILSSQDAMYECLIKLEEEVKLSLKNVRIETYELSEESKEEKKYLLEKEKETNAQFKNELDRIKDGDHVTYCFSSEKGREGSRDSLRKYIEDITVPNDPVQIKVESWYNTKMENDAKHYVLAYVKGSKKAIDYVRRTVKNNPHEIKIISEKISSLEKKPESLND